MALPGRGADFWNWAIKTESVTFKHALESYISCLEESTKINRKLNSCSARNLRRGKFFGLLAAPAATIAGIISVLSTL